MVCCDLVCSFSTLLCALSSLREEVLCPEEEAVNSSLVLLT